MKVRLPALGTKRTSSAVRSKVAIGRKADMTRTAHFGSFDPERAIGRIFLYCLS